MIDLPFRDFFNPVEDEVTFLTLRPLVGRNKVVITRRKWFKFFSDNNVFIPEVTTPHFVERVEPVPRDAFFITFGEGW